MEQFQEKVNELFAKHETLLSRKNIPLEDGNGIFTRYQHPVLTAAHTPIFWRYDLDEKTNPYLMERIGMNATMNSGAIKWNGKYILMVRVEGSDRKSFFAVAESPNGVDNFRFWDYPVTMPDDLVPATNIYDMRLTAHEDGWVYGIFCAERHDPNAAPGDLSSATATAAIARTKDLRNWERLPDLKTKSQQRNVVLHPEFVNGKYALYTRPQDGFIDAGSGGGIGWALIDDITHAEVKEETIIDQRYYHTIKEVKNGEGPHPIKTPRGWLHLAHGVRGCAAGLRYVLYMYMTALEDPTRPIATPAGYFMAPENEERIGDVSNVLFSNGWIADEDGTVYIYYASSDTRMHVAVSTIDKLVDYCMNTPADGLTASSSAQYLLTKWLTAYGLTTEDVRIQNTDAVPGLQAFFEGEGDAIVLWAPYSYTGDEHGLKVAATSRSVNAPQSVLLMADKDFAAAHPSQVASFLRVYLRAVRMMREESVATLAEDYKTFFKEWAGKTMSDAEVIKDITIHQVFLLEDQLRMFNAEHSRSDMQDWLASIIRFHAGDAYSQDKTEELLGLVTGAFLEKVERPIPEYR